MPPAISRTFDLLIFDWDGTAVAEREAKIPELLAALERVLQSQITCAIITGTNIKNLLTQGLASLSPTSKKSLFVCTNRGSEVWAFDSEGQATLTFRREATAEENASLDQAARALKAYLNPFGLSTEIIFDRLNRRKVDLIPEPRWAAPKKAEFRELFTEVNARLKSKNIPGGLAGLIRQADQLSGKAGLNSPRITSVIKHIEIGLTDKSDSIRWVFENLIQKKSIPITRVAILGDEFGSIGELPGSDAKFRIPELREAKFFSVGVEPEGVPAWVNHLGGGPTRFVRFLEEDVQPKMLAWQVIQEGFEPSQERKMEALFAIGNGYMGIRGTADFPVPAAQPDLLIAGVYDRKAVILPYSEKEFITTDDRSGVETEIVPFPSPFLFHLSLGDERLKSDSGIKGHTRTLNLREGVYTEEHVFEDRAGRRLKARSTRCASLRDPHLLLQSLRLESENFSSAVTLDFSLGSKEYKSLYPHIVPKARQMNLVSYKTKESAVECAFASRTFLEDQESSRVALRFELNPGETKEIRRAVSVFTSLDTSNPIDAAQKHISQFSLPAFAEAMNSHQGAWFDFWQYADLRFERKPELTQAQRLNLYHLRSAAGTNSNSIPGKALTGRAYEGHIFWDTEIFMFPFFLYTEPEIAKSLLLYRFKTLPGAKSRAKNLGYSGACYAWESTVSGQDVTPKSIAAGTGERIPIYTGIQQIHVTADVAYAVWKYWDATLDLEFLRNYGAEILIETARFWSNRVSLSEEHYHILEVLGPDEYHFSVDDNAYTNWMARFNLEKAVWACNYLKQNSMEDFAAFATRMNLSENEIEQWKKVSCHLYVPCPDDKGIIEQFKGFHKLKRVDIPNAERYKAPVSRLFNWKQISEFKIIKQADVLMIPFLFPEAFPREILAANYEFYEPLTDHGSSLSACAYAGIAARLGHYEAAKRYWKKTLMFDLEDVMSNTALGIHPAAMGGAWSALVFHMLGIIFTENGPKSLVTPSELDTLGLGHVEFHLKYRGKRYPVSLNPSGRSLV